MKRNRNMKRRPSRRVYRISRGRQGSVFILVVVFFSILMAFAGGSMLLATHQTQDRLRYEIYKDEFAATEQAVNKAYGHIQYLIRNSTPNLIAQLEQITAPEIEGFDFPDFDVVQIFAGNETVDAGQWSGLNLYRMRYRIDATARKEGGAADRIEHEGVALSQNLEVTYIPLYLFAIFYDQIMEIAPSPPMFVNGLVHSNGDSYFQSANGLEFHKNVTVAGDIFYGRHPQSGQAGAAGDVKFTNGTSLVTMKRSDANGWLDSRDSDWTSAATAKWGSSVKDSTHGVNPLNPPIPSGTNPHVLIERAAASDSYAVQQEKLENKAGMKIYSDQYGNLSGKDQYGNAVALTYPNPSNPSQTKSIVSATTFYDAREGKTVTSIDVNLANMIEGGIRPANGILYVSNEDQSGKPGVVRLTNGSKLPQGTVEGFTVATDDPLYIKGDYNTVNKTLAMVAGDALMILSNAWNDANGSNYSARTASATTVNTVCIQGNVPTANNNYSGGVENYFRFLENWSGKNFTFSGSIIQLFQSEKFKGKWGSSNVYSPPNRIWSWDTNLGGINGPPGAPRVVQLEKQDWTLSHGT